MPSHHTYPCAQVGCILSDGTDFRLGKWMDRQRQKQRDGTLSKERESLLQTLVDDGRYNSDMVYCTFLSSTSTTKTTSEIT